MKHTYIKKILYKSLMKNYKNHNTEEGTFEHAKLSIDCSDFEYLFRYISALFRYILGKNTDTDFPKS